MPAVCSNKARRSSGSATPKRRATPGRCQTGSIAILVTRTSRASVSTVPSGTSRPSATAAWISGMLMCARVTEMVGRMSSPAASSSANTSVTRWPQGSSETMAEPSAHCGKGPIGDRGARVGQVRPMPCFELPGGDGQGPIDGVGPGMGADRVAVAGGVQGRDDRAAGLRVGRAPADGPPDDCIAWMGRQHDGARDRLRRVAARRRCGGRIHRQIGLEVSNEARDWRWSGGQCSGRRRPPGIALADAAARVPPPPQCDTRPVRPLPRGDRRDPLPAAAGRARV